MRNLFLWIAAVALGVNAASAQNTAPLSPAEKAMVAYIDAHEAESNALLEKLVEINSGTHNLDGVRAVGKVMTAELGALGFEVKWIPMDEVERAGVLVAKHTCPLGDGKCMVRRPIARKISVVGGWSAQMYPAYLWSDAPGHNGVRASPVYKVGRT